MQVRAQSVLCASCGAGIVVPDDLDSLSCAHCGTPLTIVRGEGYVAAKLAERVGAQIAASGAATVDELRRLQLRQEVVATEDRLAALAAEGRTLRRQSGDRAVRAQLAQVQLAHDQRVYRLWELQDALGEGRTSHYIFYPPRPAPNPAGRPLLDRLSNRQVVALLFVVAVLLMIGMFLAVPR